MGEVLQSFHALSRQTTLPSPPHVHQPEFSLREWSWVSSFWVLTEASLHRQDWLSHWPFIVQPPAPLPSLEVRELGRTKSSNLQIIWFFPLKTSPHLWVFSKSHLTNMTKTSLSLSSLKKFQQFLGILCQKWEWRPYINNFYKSQYHRRYLVWLEARYSFKPYVSCTILPVLVSPALIRYSHLFVGQYSTAEYCVEKDPLQTLEFLFYPALPLPVFWSANSSPFVSPNM